LIARPVGDDRLPAGTTGLVGVAILTRAPAAAVVVTAVAVAVAAAVAIAAAFAVATAVAVMAAAVAVVAAALVARAPVGTPLARRWNDVQPPATTAVTGDATPAVVVHGTLTLPRHERAAAVLVLEDETRARPVRPREHDRRAAIRAVGVVERVVVHHDTEPHARIVIRVPRPVAHILVAVIAQEAGIVVVPLDVIGNHVVVPIAVAPGDDASGEIRERHV